MTPQAFLAAVLPPPGHGLYCGMYLPTLKGAPIHHFDAAIDGVLAWSTRINAKRQYSTYFALSTFEQAGSREAVNARFIKAFFLDLDGYASNEEALAALQAFIDVAGLGVLPAPMLVASGGGIHVYWPLDKAVEIAKWKPVAERLKRLCEQHKFSIDMSVTADAARVLRLPGTFNVRRDKPCGILYGEPTPVTIEEFSAAVGAPLHATLSAAAALVIPGVKPKAADTAVGVKLLQNSTVQFKNLLMQVARGKGCAQIGHYVDNATNDGLEPLWRGILSLAKVCEDGEMGARVISDMHPYDETRMQQKLREIKGPYPCIKFDSENPGVCTKCPHWGKITNPLALARETQIDDAPKQIEAAPLHPTDAVPPVATFVRPPPPAGFSYGKHGGIYEVVANSTDPDAPPQMSLVLPYDLFVTDILHQSNEHLVHMVAVRPGGSQIISLPQRASVTKDDMCKALAAHNIIATGRGDQKLFNYVRGCIEMASTNKAPLNVPTQFGWQKDGSFVLDGKIISPGIETPTPLPGLDNIVSATKASGRMEEWRRVVETLIKYKLWDILAITTIGFGAPLMRFTSFDGLTFHLGSSESGTGKSVSLEMVSSIWGHPKHYRVSKETSGVAMQQRLGMLNSLPLVCDEITQKNRNNFEWFPGFIFDMTDGKGKERMEGGSNRERTNTTYWSSLALLSSNTHAMDYLSSRKHSSQGEIYRLLELQMSKKFEDVPKDLSEALKTRLQHNYGHAGAAFMRWVINNMQTVKEVLAAIEEDVLATVQKSPDERFWAAGIVACLAGGVLAGRNYANIVDLPMAEIKRVFIRMITSARAVAHTSRRDADDVLNAYIREFFGKFIVVRKTSRGVETYMGQSGITDESLTRTEVCGRVEREFKPGRTDFFIEEQLLKRFCSTMSFGYTDFKAQMIVKYGAYATRKNMLQDAKGPAMHVSVLKISIPIARDEELTGGPADNVRDGV